MDAFSLAAKLTLDSKDFERDLGKQEGVFKQFGNKLGSAFSTVGKVGAAAIGAAATAVGALTKTAVESYAEYQQLVGGVETLFGIGGKSLQQFAKESGKTAAHAVMDYRKVTQGQRTVLQNAQKAYKTAGLSMNQYMETVTSFSASLIQSLQGDQAKAAKVADQAIIDMSDNANKMGTSMEAIQNAYQGFAKQNYTMLDNLKLGYGGTKTEMERLIADANKVKQANGEMADLSIERFSDVVEAIHIIQTEMGITGTTAEEAEKTISGSIGMMKASWENLVTALGNGNADIGPYIDNLVSSAEIAFGNIMPVVEQALTGIASFVEKIAPVIAEKLPGMVEDVLPKLLNAAGSILEGVINALPALFTTLFTAIGNIDWLSLGTSVWNAIKVGFAGIAGWFSGLFEDGKKAIGEINWAEAGTDLLTKIGNGLADIANWFKKKFDAASTGIAQVNWKQVGEDVKTAIGNGLTAIKEWFHATFLPGPDGIALVDWKGAGTAILGAIGEAFAAVIEFFQGLFSGVPEALTTGEGLDWAGAGETILGLIGSAFSTIGEWITTLFGPAVTALTGEELDWSTAGKNILDAIKDGIGNIKEWATNHFKDAIPAIGEIEWKSAGSDLWDKIKEGIGNVSNWFIERFTSAKLSIKNAIDWNGLGTSILGYITSAVSSISNDLKQFFDNAVTKIKGIPWADIGTWISDKVDSTSQVVSTYLEKAFEAGKSLIEEIPWADIGQWISDKVNSKAELISNTLELAFNAGKSLIEEIPWADIGTTINSLIETTLPIIATTLESSFDAGKTLIENIPWDTIGTTINTLLDGKNLSAVKDTLKAAFDGGKTLIEKIEWDQVGTAITSLVETGIEGLGGVLEAAGKAGFDLIKSIKWVELGKSIVNLIAQGISPIIIPVYRKMMGWVDDIVGDVETTQGDIKISANSKGVTFENTKTDEKTTIEANPNDLLKTNNYVKQGLKNLFDNIFNNKNTDRDAGSGKFATAMSGGKILRGATVFGFNDNGPMIGGEAGPEAIVGVNSLDQMIANSVQKGLSGIVAGIAQAIGGRNEQPVYVVLDTGELVGAIGGKMDAELGKIGDWKGGGRA